MSVRLAVLVSGGGTTLQNLLDQIGGRQLDAHIALVISSRADAPALERAARAQVATAVIPPECKSDETRSAFVFDRCRQQGVELVVLAGFLRRLRIPMDFVLRVINTHPALMPAFCGKGFYGLRVHQAVLDYGVKLTGCTIHFADDEYDHGPIILQRPVPVADDDTAESLAARVFAAECSAYPEAIRLFSQGRLRVVGRRVQIASKGNDRV